MIELFLNHSLESSSLTSIMLMIIIYLIIIFRWSKWQISNPCLKQYLGMQRIHEGEIPRLGGLVIYAGLIVYFLLEFRHQKLIFIGCVLISSLPLFLVALKEDLFHNTSPILRLIAMSLSVILFFLLYEISFPIIDIPFFGIWFNQSLLLNSIFFLFCMLVIINGSNLIDGANGLLSITSIMQLLSLIYICYISNDVVNMTNLFILIIPLLIFTIFNYPLGRIFLGDTGAYLIGFFTGLISIIIFSEHPEVPTWLAVLILFYPGFELLFTIIRRFFNCKKQMDPDQGHLHNMMFKYLNNKLKNTHASNSLVMPCFLILWGLPFLLLIFVMDNIVWISLSILLMIIIYINLYFIFYRIIK
jgi:UDP-GlcNAc:undecaprenyl-phosphate GlcNAc-1-phosphate transferase